VRRARSSGVTLNDQVIFERDEILGIDWRRGLPRRSNWPRPVSRSAETTRFRSSITLKQGRQRSFGIAP